MPYRPGQLLIVGSLPTYSRFFDPAAYGEYLVFVGAIGVLGVFAGVRYDSAIVLPRSDRLAAALSVLVMLIAHADHVAHGLLHAADPAGETLGSSAG